MTVTFPIISSDSIVDTYNRVREALRQTGNDQIIFKCMRQIDQTFFEPTNSSEYTVKHQEIQNILEFSDLFNAGDKAFSLFEEIWKEIKSLGGIAGVSLQDLLKAFEFQTSTPEVFVTLTDDVKWAVTTTVILGNNQHRTKIMLYVSSKNDNWIEIVPKYIIEYVLSSVNAYKQNMYSSAIALLTIAVEATLRDVLATKGYTFQHDAQKTPVYHSTKANVNVDGNSYKLTFQESLPKSPADFQSLLSTSSPVEVQIRRTVKKRIGRDDRIDFNIISPLPDLLDYWSKDTKESEADENNVGGLGEALNIARTREGFLTPAILPLDVDEVIQKVRNNLIHLSGDSLQAELPSLGITLKEFLNDERKVYSLMTRVPRFINGQYIDLKQQGV
ncbi:hypothetical protein OCE40_15040 [Bacillus toyonensis]|uniref:hypothetical protein n=1 Tax=Bacillus toyonensis TaxID=155322 RepID=UPI001040BF36|nr:hypothetical protein [Bacillus toyonensis]MCU5303201.1 hypothetical protein [Bacillus toyonensis]TBX46482.1 hypothetical protein E0M44_16315 [Bacillus toyonensis]